MNTVSHKKIMIVDDEATARMLLAHYFTELGFEVVECASGEACLEAMSDEVAILMLDVGLPGIDGIETCRRLRAAGHEKLQVIFISAHDDLNTRLTAYDAGGNDFILKPFEQDEIERKVRVAERAIASYEDVAGQAQFAQAAAFAAISSMGEMGVVLEFVRRSFSCRSSACLAAETFSALRQLNLDGLIGCMENGALSGFAAQGACSALEHSILENSRQLQRIFQFSNRLAINYPRVTLLVTNLPMQDSDLCGRLRDHLAVIAECADARLEAIAQEKKLLAQNLAIASNTQALVSAIAEMRRDYEAGREAARRRSGDFLDELEDAFVHLGLTEAQEAELLRLANVAFREVEGILDRQQGLESRFQSVLAAPERACA